jgi:protein gp37
MNKTKIEYLDYTWNPIVGCSGVGCAVVPVCWAARTAKRQKGKCDACYSFEPHVHWERLDQPAKVKASSRVGVSFSGEFYDKEISESVRGSVYIEMSKAPWHRYIIFTKQPQNIDTEEVESLSDLGISLSIGVSVNQQYDSWRVDSIRDLPVSCRIVSAEPVYGKMDLDLKGIDLLIIGAQTRPNVQPKREWVESLIQCARIYGAKVFLKDNLSPFLFPLPTPERFRELPDQLCITAFEKQHHRLEVRSK